MTSLVLAYSVVFAAIFAYTWLIASRQKKLEKKLEDIRELVKDTAKQRR